MCFLYKKNVTLLLKILSLWTIFILMNSGLFSQILHKKNESARSNIDAKAVATPINSKEALARGREFIEIDSTYFLGYMYEGVYKVRHAQDIIGFKNATEPLEYAYQLLLRDYEKELTKRSDDVFDVYYNYQIQMYFQELVYNLWEAYMNAQEFQKAYNLTVEVAHTNIQMEYYFQSYTHIAWIIHKLRIFTSKEYPFLKDNVYGNVRLAMSYLDSAYDKADKDHALNAEYFGDLYTENIYGIAHFQAIFYTYLFQMDSAAFYYDLLKSRGRYSHGNRGNFLYVSGKFRQAEEEYIKAGKSISDEMAKELKEHIYYTSFIEINKGADRNYLIKLKNTLKYENSKPGYGWYNLAMARTLLYSGQIAQSEEYIRKAENFKELHIGTTLGTEHYQLSLYMIKYLKSNLELSEFKKKHDSWYWNPINWFKVAGMAFDRYVNRFNLVSLLSKNPEREQVIYPVFASESVVYWNEVMAILNEINPDYFIDYYEKAVSDNDQRPAILPYQKLILANLYITEKEWKKAEELLEEVLMDVQVDQEYESYLIAKTLALKSIVAAKTGDRDVSKKWYYEMYRVYPSLALTEKGELDVYIQNRDKLPKELIRTLTKSDLNIVNTAGPNTIVVSVKYEFRAQQHHAAVIVADTDANILISEIEMRNDSLSDLGDDLYAAIFGYVSLTDLTD